MAEAQGGLIQAPEAPVAEMPPASQHKNFHEGIRNSRGEETTGTELEGAGAAEELAVLA
jgi:hypothetical protein